jgi:hypothetical protein
MKHVQHIILTAALALLLGLSSCGNGKPNTDDPTEYAKWVCEKSREFVELSNEPLTNAKKMLALANEMGAADREFEEKHKDNLAESKAKKEAAIKEFCGDLKTLSEEK